MCKLLELPVLEGLCVAATERGPYFRAEVARAPHMAEGVGSYNPGQILGDLLVSR